MTTSAGRMEVLHIDKLVYGGDGLGRLADGQVCFVPGVAPGETVTVHVPEVVKKKSRLVGSLVRVDTPDEKSRVTPRCSVFEQCGGCQWQHMDVRTQRTWKKTIVEETMRRIGRLNDVEVLPVWPHDDAEAWHYRNHVQWHAEPNDGKLKLGYYQPKTHQVVGFDECVIAHPVINRLYHLLNLKLPESCGVSQVIARVNESGEALLMILGRTMDRAFLDPFFKKEFLPSVPSDIHLNLVFQDGVAQWIAQGKAGLDYQIPSGDKPIEFFTSADSFFQVHQSLVPHLLKMVTDRLPFSLNHLSDTLLDLYAGVGLFSVALAPRFARVTSIEGSPSSYANAWLNAEREGLHHLRILEGSVDQAIYRLDESFTVAVIDPPRTGCPGHVLDWLHDHVTQKIIYVSCDPTTLARDLAILTEKGWMLDAIQPIDLFPQTYHIECIASLTKPAPPATQEPESAGVNG